MQARRNHHHPGSLVEGMREGDLDGLVLPLISIDEYRSKVDPKAVVIGFYVEDQSAANDLNRFLQKSPIDLLDTDVSPAPDQKGYFMTFVEMLNNDSLPKNLETITRELRSLTAIRKWQMRIRGHDKVQPLNRKLLVKHLAAMRKEMLDTNEMLDFLQHSRLANARLDDSNLLIEACGRRFRLEVADFGDLDYLLQKHDLDGKPVSFDSYDRWKCGKVQNVLGEGWEVHCIRPFQIIVRSGHNCAILART